MLLGAAWSVGQRVHMCVGAARRGCLGLGTRVHGHAGVVRGAGFEGASASACFTARPSVPRCVSHRGT